jgi:uncharacterized protein with PIN domain
VSAGEPQDGFPVVLTFHGDLAIFLKRHERGRKVRRVLREKTAIKDAIEACGVPHPEVDLILCDGVAVQFTHQLTRHAVLDVHPVGSRPEGDLAVRLQRRRIRRFVADGHLGKLVRNLRLLGIDVAYSPIVDDAELIRIGCSEDRAVLTRDRRLLMHSAVRDGYFPRSQMPDEQTIEVLRRFELGGLTEPYTRCLRCNGLLCVVEKSSIDKQLEPLTREYYEVFRRCTTCGNVYWSGSHFSKLEARVARLLAALSARPIDDDRAKNWA